MKRTLDLINSGSAMTGCPSRQSGVTTLIITIILVAVSTLGALAVSRSAFFEQQITGVDIRNREVYAAAISGLEYGVQAMRGSIEVWVDVDADGTESTGDTSAPPALANTSQGIDEYTHTILYTLMTGAEPNDGPAIIKIESTATAATDTHVTKTVTVYAMQSAVFTATIAEGPPVVVEGCVNGAGGTPNLFPGGTSPDYAPALLSTQGDGSAGCMDPGNFDSFAYTDPDGDGVADTLVSLGTSETGLLSSTDPNCCTLFETIFGSLTENDIRQLAEDAPNSVVFLDSSNLSSWVAGSVVNAGNFNGEGGRPTMTTGTGNNLQVGGPGEAQVLLYIDDSAGCVDFLPMTFYGLIYYDTEDCDLGGWGQVEIHGTLAVEGDLTQFNANTDIYGDVLSAASSQNSTATIVTLVPGSWRDFCGDTLEDLDDC